MKNLFIIALSFLFLQVSYAGDKGAKTVKLTQTPGEFATKELKLKEGVYVFEVMNKGVDHECGFVVAPMGKTDQKNHIPEAYLMKTIKNGETSKSKEVALTKGEYVYFCPMNPTPQYKLIVE